MLKEGGGMQGQQKTKPKVSITERQIIVEHRTVKNLAYFDKIK